MCVNTGCHGQGARWVDILNLLPPAAYSGLRGHGLRQHPSKRATDHLHRRYLWRTSTRNILQPLVSFPRPANIIHTDKWLECMGSTFIRHTDILVRSIQMECT